MIWVIGYVNEIERVGNYNDNVVSYFANNGIGLITIKNEPAAITSNLLVRKTGINDSPLGDTRFKIIINNLNNSSWGHVRLGSTELTVNGEYPDWYNDSYAINDNDIKWHYGIDSNNRLFLIVYATSNASANHQDNSNTIYLHDLDFIDTETPITYSVSEIRAASGGSNYYYELYNNGNASVNYAYASWNGSQSSNNKVYDNFGNHLTVNWFQNTEVYDFHNEPVYKTDLLLRKYSFQKTETKNVNGVNRELAVNDNTTLPLAGAMFSVEITGLGSKNISLYDHDPSKPGSSYREVWSNRYRIDEQPDGSFNLYAWDLISGKDDSRNSDMIKINGLTWASDKIHIKVKETGVPSASAYYYKVIDRDMDFDIYKSMVINDVNYTINGGTTMNSTTKDYVKASYFQPSKQTVIDVFNRKLIKLSGKVWLDEQTGEKDIDGPNGYIDAKEKGIQGVTVNLYKNNNTTSKFKDTSSSWDGTYEFKDIPYDPYGYRIGFGYDGISYIETISNKVSNGNIVIKDKIGTGTYSDATEYQISSSGSWNNSLRDSFNAGRKSVVLGSCYSVHPCGASYHSSISGTGFSTKFKYKNSTKTGEKQVSSLKYDINVNGKNSDSRCDK